MAGACSASALASSVTANRLCVTGSDTGSNSRCGLSDAMEEPWALEVAATVRCNSTKACCHVRTLQTNRQAIGVVHERRLVTGFPLETNVLWVATSMYVASFSTVSSIPSRLGSGARSRVRGQGKVRGRYRVAVRITVKVRREHAQAPSSHAVTRAATPHRVAGTARWRGSNHRPQAIPGRHHCSNICAGEIVSFKPLVWSRSQSRMLTHLQWQDPHSICGKGVCCAAIVSHWYSAHLRTSGAMLLYACGAVLLRSLARAELNLHVARHQEPRAAAFPAHSHSHRRAGSAGQDINRLLSRRTDLRRSRRQTRGLAFTSRDCSSRDLLFWCVEGLSIIQK